MVAWAWVMLLSTFRDRAALGLSYGLPPLLFIVFASIFSGASGADLKLKVAVIDLAQSVSSQRLVNALTADRSFRFFTVRGGGEASLTDIVRRGAADVGLLIRSDPAVSPTTNTAPLSIIEQTARPLAATIAVGQVMRTFNEKLPQVAFNRMLTGIERSNGMSDDAQRLIETQLNSADAGPSSFSLLQVIDRHVIREPQLRNGNLLYYAGAVVAVFLLFAGVHGSLALIDERASGLTGRLAKPGWRDPAIAGRLLFLTGQGVLQSVIVYATAFLVYGASFDPHRLGWWAITCVLAASSASAVGILMCSLSKSRRQAEAVTTFVVLLMSAVGGSMVPRYLMPPAFQQLGWFTPNAWIINGFELAVQPVSPQGLVLPWGVLCVATAVCVTVATWASMRRSSY